MNIKTKIALLALALPAAASLSYAATAGENWENNCASCHGDDGAAKTKQGKKLKIRDYTDAAVQAEFKDEDILKAILDGVKVDGKERMKGYRGEFENPEAEAKELVAFVRKLKA